VRDHRVVVGVGVLRDVEVLLQLARRIRQERPARADAGTKLIRLDQVVGRDRHETAISDLHLVVELQQPFVLPPVPRTEAAAREHEDQRIVSLQLRKPTVHGAVVRERVIGKPRAGNDVRPQRRTLSMCRPASCTASSGVRPCSRATMKAAYQSDQ
jgi:hypothetical protein